MKRYLLFCGDNYYPCGGWYDFEDSFDTIEAAKEAAYNDWWHIVDLETGKIVAEDG